MGEEHIIKTPFDVLLSTLKEASAPLSAGRLASICGMSEREVQKWLHMLEKAGTVKIENRFNGVHASWAGPMEKALPPVSPTAIDVGVPSSFESDLKLAHQREGDVKSRLAQEQEAKDLRAKRAKVDIEPSSSIDVSDARLEKVDRMIRELKGRKEESLIGAARRKAAESEETIATEIEEKPPFEAEPLEGNEGLSAEDEIAAWDARDRRTSSKESAQEEKEAREEKTASVPEEIESGHSARIFVPSKSIIKPKFRYAGTKPKKIEKIKKPEPVRVTGVSLQFSERLARQMRRIERQAREIDAVRQEKEKLLSEHYLPLQNRLESELETISDRVMRVQSRVAGMQKQASDLPAKVTAVEKVQISSIKAHGEMRRAYDEACALLEESSGQLAEEREKMEMMLEQSREELSRHSSMSSDLSRTMERIEEMEGEAESRVSTARAALAEQAGRLASAEGHANSLRQLRGEIGEGIIEMKREVASAKRVLSDLERQMGQMRQIEEYTNNIRKDYDEKMSEIDDYIRSGNREFDTLRESVEANFVRRYLRELRALSESYSFEFGQARKMEGDIDARIAIERGKLEQLFEEGKKISYLFETQSQPPASPEKFEQRAETFSALDNISSNRSQVAQMIAQVIGGRTENLPKHARISAAEAKKEEIQPLALTKIGQAVAKLKAKKTARLRKLRSAKKTKKAKKARKPRRR